MTRHRCQMSLSGVMCLRHHLQFSAGLPRNVGFNLLPIDLQLNQRTDKIQVKDGAFDQPRIIDAEDGGHFGQYVIIIIIIITKLLLNQYPRKESCSVAQLVQGLGKLIVWVQCKVHQQMNQNIKTKKYKHMKLSYHLLTEDEHL